MNSKCNLGVPLLLFRQLETTILNGKYNELSQDLVGKLNCLSKLRFRNLLFDT